MLPLNVVVVRLETKVTSSNLQSFLMLRYNKQLVQVKTPSLLVYTNSLKNLTAV